MLLILKQSVVSEPRSQSSARFDLKTAFFSSSVFRFFSLPKEHICLRRALNRQAGWDAAAASLSKSPGIFFFFTKNSNGTACGWMLPQRKGGSVGERRGIWDKNKQRLIVHKSRRSIVSGEPPAALAHVVPMKRSKRAPVGPTHGGEAA